MNILLKSTYTFATLKENILKILGEYTVNGSENSLASGFLADVDKKLISTLNICLRRVVLSLPLLEKTDNLQFCSGKAVLPDDCHEAKALLRDVDGRHLPFEVTGNTIICSSLNDGDCAYIVYRVMPDEFTVDMPSGKAVMLPDITADALCYLTASELAPAEYAELYEKLMYRYRDICHNCYNCDEKQKGRNSFFAQSSRRKLRI